MTGKAIVKVVLMMTVVGVCLATEMGRVGEKHLLEKKETGKVENA